MSSTRSRRQARLSRALGLALTPKSVKYFEKRPYPPGEHGRSRRPATSDYAVRLREKQRLRAQYGINETQMRRAFDDARKAAGRTGEALVELLETRLDAVVLRSGLARTMAQARQAVTHRHVLVDGARVDKPSYRLRPGQVVEIAARSRAMTPFLVAAAGAHQDVLPDVPKYLHAEVSDLKVTVVRAARREEVPVTCDVSLVVEHYARS